MNSQPEWPSDGSADVGTGVHPVELDERAIATAKRLRSRRTIGAVTLVTALLVVAGSVVILNMAHRSAPPQATPPTQPSPSADGGPTPDPGQTDVPVTYVSDPDLITLTASRITLPAWRGPDRSCPAGAYQFQVTRWHDTAPFGTAPFRTAPATNEATEYVIPWQPIASADLDADGVTDDLVTVYCGRAAGLLALSLRSTGVKTLGYVNIGPGGEFESYDEQTVRTAGAAVLLEVWGPPRADGGPIKAKQLRGYAYRSGAFHQVSGPTTYPSLPDRVQDLDLSNFALRFRSPVVRYYDQPFDIRPVGEPEYRVRFEAGIGVDVVEVGNDDRTMTFTEIRHTLGPILYVTTKPGQTVAAVTITSQSPTGSSSTQVCVVDLHAVPVRELPMTELSCVTLVASGVNGVTSVMLTPTSAAGVLITVTTVDGPHDYHYDQSDTAGWVRLDS
ncbi:MAG: hypothetical protein ACM30G_03005 [Micromonosporaceae bacterium]